MRRILLSHGSGGEESQKLIQGLFIKHFGNPLLNRLEDATPLDIEPPIAFTTDSFTVSPIFFRGGDIGKLSIAGTVNDLSVMGARPMYVSVGFIIEEGLSFEELERVVKSMALETRESGVLIVTGDTKVVPRGHVDKLFINTSGIGKVVYEGLSSSKLKPGDVVIVSGSVGNHGACILAEREGFEFDVPVESDCKSLWGLVESVLRTGAEIRAMRDPTRGGLAAVLNEWATQSEVEIEVQEEDIPIDEPVLGLCDLLGFEPTHLANEGIVVIAVREEDAPVVLETLRKHPHGTGAKIIGKVVDRGNPKVVLKTPYGAKRLMEPPTGELLPRIC